MYTLAGRAILTQKVVHVTDALAVGAKQFPDAWQSFKREGTRTALAVPLLRVEPGLPLGVQLIGRAGQDRALCQLGNWLTQTAEGRPT
mgnify:CR=1 FL=1